MRPRLAVAGSDRARDRWKIDLPSLMHRTSAPGFVRRVRCGGCSIRASPCPSRRRDRARREGRFAADSTQREGYPRDVRAAPHRAIRNLRLRFVSRVGLTPRGRGHVRKAGSTGFHLGKSSPCTMYRAARRRAQTTAAKARADGSVVCRPLSPRAVQRRCRRYEQSETPRCGHREGLRALAQSAGPARLRPWGFSGRAFHVIESPWPRSRSRRSEAGRALRAGNRQARP